MDTESLTNRWTLLFPDAEYDLAVASMDDLVARYRESHRHYHTLSHVSACLALFDSVRDKFDDFIAVELALWFHDVIYDPTKNDNEDRSADYAEAALIRLGVSRQCVNTVCELIGVTKHPSVPSNDDEAYLVDVDLAILGAPDEVYRQYAAQIRAEYSHVSDSRYRVGRVALLERFLTQESLYFTDYFRGRFDAAARENIRREIGRLTGR